MKIAGPTLKPLQPVVRPAREPRSFVVQNDRTDGICRRTRSQLKPRPEVRDDSTKEPPPTTPETAVAQDSSATSPQKGQATKHDLEALQILQTD
ncbi:hypothetical protein P5673_002403 [Acropora cervicornis]|uniref:Uncharacterized protein n=1 Tax=Acropora cervicornis TaxID=6130 RepID=A0AAD9VFL9_ACRCE|nr:hypothetical protein P5673_002403 [Acropora cervicornis]